MCIITYSTTTPQGKHIVICNTWLCEQFGRIIKLDSAESKTLANTYMTNSRNNNGDL